MVEAWSIVGYGNRITADENFTQARKEFAEIPSGAATTVFYELDLAEYVDKGDSLNLGDVEVRWVTPISSESNRQRAQILVRYEDARTAETALCWRWAGWRRWLQTDTPASRIRVRYTMSMATFQR